MPRFNEDSRKIAENIFGLLLPYLRLTDSTDSCGHAHHAQCFYGHVNLIQKRIMESRQISFVLPAFPAKSSNFNKTVGPYPDMGERLSLKFLNNLCNEMTRFHAPGAKIIICSDGRVFNDLVLVSDANVSIYTNEISRIIYNDNLSNLTTYSLEDHYQSTDFVSVREQLVDEYGEIVDLIKGKVKANHHEKNIFNGIHRFIFEDQSAVMQYSSKNELRKSAKETAYKVIQRSNAWSRFVEKQFPDSIRLSIHPQSCGSKKLGIMLLKSTDHWATPWHRVAIYNGAEYVLMRRIEAENLGARAVYSNNRFSHYVA
ncbi:hypothetical protein AQUSIP_24830 [Aquicella siphonis]|uniref:Pyoverdine/dityrosine biosynthesis protein n=1 Tax=Aquicella siphonis TaxID=254247 RepID=A0A5E4PLQ3_9COXI|nr:isocyanide synthase family protein [Aquicella siphonis]VVC77156.1 hypothetical protein AQUSIP_24830 [Aquicella siphonis]